MGNSLTPQKIDIRSFRDSKGTLSVVEASLDIPFDIKRIYYLHHVPSKETRGAHAHKDLWQLFIPIAGSFSLTLDDGDSQRKFILSDKSTGLIVPPGYWRDLGEFTPESVCLVLASMPYSEEDYLRDYDDFLSWKTLHKDNQL